MVFESIKLNIKGMTCDGCAKGIEAKFKNIKGVLAKTVSYKNGFGEFQFDGDLISKEKIIEVITAGSHYEVADEIKENRVSIPDIKKANVAMETQNYEYDLIILGGGSAAFSAAIKTSELGGKAVIINDGLPIGGTCVNVGCVPSKILIRAAEQFHNMNHSNFASVTSNGGNLNFNNLIKHKSAIVTDLRTKKYIDVISDDENVKIVTGRGSVIDKNTVTVNGTNYKGKNILIVTGSTTFIPNLEGLDSVKYYVNDTIYELDSLPEHLIVLGGRYIALENAQMFARLGSKVTVIQRSNNILPDEDNDLSEYLTDLLRDEGLEILTGTKINNVREIEGKVSIDLIQDGTEKTIEGTHLLISTGRKGNSNNIGLENVGVETFGKGYIKTDETLHTTAKGIYAAGDVLGKNMFVYTAAYEGALAAENAFTNSSKKRNYSPLPWVVFTNPQAAGVGLNEKEAEAQGIEYEVSRIDLKDIPRAIAAQDMRGFIKLLRNKNTDALIGARILAPEGSELLMELSVAIKFGVTVTELKNMFHPYLTLSEGIKLAAISFNKDVGKLSCCAV